MAQARIMVVEDEVIVAETICMKLVSFGYEVTDTAVLGQEALEKAFFFKPDLILMDIHLKGDLDGINAARKIKEQYNIPVIFLTAFADEETINSAKVAEPYGYLLKPFKDKELHSNIEMALYRHQMELELSEKKDELDLYNRITAHDMASPLVNIHGSTSVIQMSIKEILEIIDREGIATKGREEIRQLMDNEINKATKAIFSSTKKLQDLLDGLKELRKIGALKPNKKILNMNVLFKKILHSFEFQLQEAGAELILGNLPGCYGDMDMLDQVFSNLLDNAIKFLAPDRKGRIEISGEMKKSNSIYKIEDNGIGINSSDQDKIFRIYQRLNKKITPGEGLGIAMVQKILSLHKGEIRAESEEGKGSIFYVILPAK
jgi:signal transduction histidine kinase